MGNLLRWHLPPASFLSICINNNWGDVYLVDEKVSDQSDTHQLNVAAWQKEGRGLKNLEQSSAHKLHLSCLLCRVIVHLPPSFQGIFRNTVQCNARGCSGQEPAEIVLLPCCASLARNSCIVGKSRVLGHPLWPAILNLSRFKTHLLISHSSMGPIELQACGGKPTDMSHMRRGGARVSRSAWA